MTRDMAVAAALCGLALAGGCSAFDLAPPTPATRSPQFNAVWDASLEVLRGHHFVIDRADRRAGVMTTERLLGRHWFEFWRADAATRGDVAESSIQTIYRRATVRIRPAQGAAGDDGQYVAEVTVRTSRSDLPNIRVTSTSEAYELFQAPSLTLRGRAAALPEKDQTLRPTDKPTELGEDKILAHRLSGEIAGRAVRKLALVRAE